MIFIFFYMIMWIIAIRKFKLLSFTSKCIRVQVILKNWINLLVVAGIYAIFINFRTDICTQLISEDICSIYLYLISVHRYLINITEINIYIKRAAKPLNLLTVGVKSELILILLIIINNQQYIITNFQLSSGFQKKRS